MMLTLQSLRCFMLTCLFAGGLSLHDRVVADGQIPTLGEQRLFMSDAQRKQIEKRRLPTELQPVENRPEVPVVEKKVAPKLTRVSLNGAVVRPDGTAVLMLNDKTRKIAYKQDPGSASFSFSINYKNKVVTLTPGQTVWVESDRE